jgi:hypothetical protein
LAAPGVTSEASRGLFGTGFLAALHPFGVPPARNDRDRRPSGSAGSMTKAVL